MTHFTLPQPGHVGSDLRDAFAERLADLSVPLNERPWFGSPGCCGTARTSCRAGCART